MLYNKFLFYFFSCFLIHSNFSDSILCSCGTLNHNMFFGDGSSFLPRRFVSFSSIFESHFPFSRFRRFESLRGVLAHIYGVVSNVSVRRTDWRRAVAHVLTQSVRSVFAEFLRVSDKLV